MLLFEADRPVAGNALLTAIQEQSQARVQDCYQCGKCTAGCPVSSFMDLMPRQVMRAVQLGQADLVAAFIDHLAVCQLRDLLGPLPHGNRRGRRHGRACATWPSAAASSRPRRTSCWSTACSSSRSSAWDGSTRSGVVAGLNLGTLHPFANVIDVGAAHVSAGQAQHPCPSAARHGEVQAHIRRSKEAVNHAHANVQLLPRLFAPRHGQGI